jgi:hypothetical protein
MLKDSGAEPISLTPADLKNVVAAAGGRYPEDTLVLIRQLSRPAMSHPS